MTCLFIHKKAKAIWIAACFQYSSVFKSPSHDHQTIAKVSFKYSDLLCMISWYPAVWDISISGISKAGYTWHSYAKVWSVELISASVKLEKGNCYFHHNSLFFCLIFLRANKKIKDNTPYTSGPRSQATWSFFIALFPGLYRSSNKSCIICEVCHSLQFDSPTRSKDTGFVRHLTPVLLSCCVVGLVGKV